MELSSGIYLLLTNPFEDHLKTEFKNELTTNKEFYSYTKWEYTHLLTESYEFILEFLNDIIPNLQIKDVPCNFNHTKYIRKRWFIGEDDIFSNRKYTYIEHLINMLNCIYCFDNIIINHFDTELHPCIVKNIIKELLELDHDFTSTIVIDSFSPIIVSEFGKVCPDNVLIFNNNDIFRLPEIRDREWLKFFTLGDLYGNEFCGYNAEKEERILNVNKNTILQINNS